MSRIVDVDCCIAGGGPAGMMAGLLFARAGSSTLVLEKHADFLRDFRGDTIHPSTLEIMRELGLLEAFLERPHQRMSQLSGVFGGEKLRLADFSSLSVAAKFIAFMPQWHFLDFLSGAARSMPTFAIEMRAEATGLIESDGRIAGVRAQTSKGALKVRAKLTIGADGRHSLIRDAGGFAVEDVGAPIDVLWFRVPREPGSPAEEPLLHTGPGHIVITIDRGDYDQCAFVIPKGEAEEVKARGLEAFRSSVARTVPRLAGAIDAVQTFDDVKLLTVKVDRLERWSRPGLLMIGDAAHAMSPVGGVGINLAIQDAVAAANLLAGPLADSTLSDDALDGVRRRRTWAVRATQMMQVAVQNFIVAPLLEGRSAPKPPLPVRIVAALPWLQRRFASIVGLGFKPEHVRAPERYRIKLPAQSAGAGGAPDSS